jgi:tRNA threonylcarbamoyladenosine biosynthesis protein TsaB
MILLTIRTDKPEAEIGLYDGQKQLKYEVWYAHRELAETLHQKILALLQSQSKELKDLDGLVVYAGPGSFTGLRIGITVANALAYSYHIPVLGMNEDQWLERGIERLQKGEKGTVALPEYGGEIHVTAPRK